MRNNRLLWLGLMLTALLASCDSNVLYSEYERIDTDGWNASDAKTFIVEADDTASTYLCSIDLRNSINYQYSNIYFSIKTIYPDGSVAADTNIEFILAQPDGRWLGKQSGRYVDGRYPFCYFHFPQNGLYMFYIQQAMRDTSLAGIKDLGLHIEKIE